MYKIRITERDRERFIRMSQIEASYRERGYQLIAGIDEVGRGPLAGPVFAAACILPDGETFYGLNDSKKMTEKRREYLYQELVDRAVSWSIASVDTETIDRINILEASKLAMSKALSDLSVKADMALVDAVTLQGFDIPVLALLKGDAKSNVIAAASVLAKVSRDRLMTLYDSEYPQYSFASNKGYGTKEHIAAIKEYGACPLHRRSFLKNINPKKYDSWQTGINTEYYVASYLIRNNYQILGQRVKSGNLAELDIVAIKDQCLYIIEVKGRSNSAYFGDIENALTSEQLSRIKQSAQAFAERHDLGDLPIEILFAACNLNSLGSVTDMQLLAVN